MRTSIPRLPLSKRNKDISERQKYNKSPHYKNLIDSVQETAVQRNNQLHSSRPKKTKQKSLILPNKKRNEKSAKSRKNSKSEMRDKISDQSKILCLEDPSALVKSNSYIQNNSVNERKYSFSLLENDSSKVNSSKSFEGINMQCNINRCTPTYKNNIDTESCSYDYSKDISINDCFRFNDPDLSSIEKPYALKNTEESSNKWRTSGNKENTSENIHYFTSKGVENTNSYESNHSIEMGGTSDQHVASPFNTITNIASSSYKLNHTGKFAFGPFNCNKPSSIEANNEGFERNIELSNEAKIALNDIDKLISDINQFYYTRWEILRHNLINTCEGFETDEVIKVMMDDEESKKYVVQRMQEILQDQWSSERETAIYQLTKQLGILELKHSMLITQINNKMNNQSIIQRTALINAKCGALEEQIVQLKKEVELKDQEIRMYQALNAKTPHINSSSKNSELYSSEYNEKIESILGENMNLKAHITYLTNELNHKDSCLEKFESREADLRNSIKDLETQVNAIKENQSKSLPENSWSVENAIQMFNSRLQQLEKEKENHSEDEKENLKTPLNITSTDEQKVYISKLKKTLRVYKGRSKDFEKRCIELECINCALQKDIHEMKEKVEQSNTVYEQNCSLKEEYAKQVAEIHDKYKKKLNDKKTKHLEKMKELEIKFTKLCENRMKEIQDELKSNNQSEYSIIIQTKEKEIEELKNLIENECISIKEHEDIVNNTIIKMKKSNAQEIERLCDQFEKDLMQAQEENDQEKELIHNQFKEQILELQAKLKKDEENYFSVQSSYNKLEKDIDSKSVCIKKLEEEKTLLLERIRETTESNNKIESSKFSDIKSLEDSIYRLNKDLNTKNTKIHQLELENEKLKSQSKEQEKTHKFNISLYEKKIKEASGSNDNKVKQAVAENVILAQKILKLEENLRTARVTILHKDEELEELIKEYDTLKMQHQEISKEAEKLNEYARYNGKQVRQFSFKRSNTLKSILSTVSSKCKQFKNELEFIKKCYKEELKIMLKYIESTFSDISTKCNCVNYKIKEECLKQIREVSRKADEDVHNQANRLKEEFASKLESLNRKCEIGEEKYNDIQCNLEESVSKIEQLTYKLEECESKLHQKEKKIEICENKLNQYEEEIDSYFSENINDLKKEFDKQNEINEIEDQSKIHKMKVMTNKKIEKLKNKIEEMQRVHYEEKLKVKEEYQDKIDTLFKESYTNIQRLSEADSEIEILRNKTTLLEQETERFKTVIKSVLNETNIEISEDQNIEQSLHSLITRFKESERMIDKIKQDNNDK